jgi:hypothetical protein
MYTYHGLAGLAGEQVKDGVDAEERAHHLVRHTVRQRLQAAPNHANQTNDPVS